MDTKLWKFIGTSRRTDGVKIPGLVKFRFSNFSSRKKALEETGNAEVNMFELPAPMSKKDAIKWYAETVPHGERPI
jgi:hypothetical protein